MRPLSISSLRGKDSVAEGTPAQMQNHPDVIEAYLGAGAHV